jgi:hypothetical protein
MKITTLAVMLLLLINCGCSPKSNPADEVTPGPEAERLWLEMVNKGLDHYSDQDAAKVFRKCFAKGDLASDHDKFLASAPSKESREYRWAKRSSKPPSVDGTYLSFQIYLEGDPPRVFDYLIAYSID